MFFTRWNLVDQVRGLFVFFTGWSLVDLVRGAVCIFQWVEFGRPGEGGCLCFSFGGV